MAEQGWEVGDTFYELPNKFRFGDPVLIREVTGMSWATFSDLVETDVSDPSVMGGLLAVAVWQKNTQWRRDRVVRFIESLDMESVTFIGDEEADASPPGEESSPKDDGSNSKSNKPPDSISDTSLLSTTPDGSRLTTQGLA